MSKAAPNHLHRGAPGEPLHRTRSLPLLSRTLLCILLAATAATPYPARVALAQGGPTGRISRVIPFAGVLIGWKHRNRVYRSAEEFIRERKQYYDALRNTARQQLVQREQLGLRKSQVAAYTKVVALIEQHRQTEMNVAESRKRQARAEFHGRVEDALIYALAGNRLVQQVIDSLRNGVGSAQQALERALSKITSGGSDALRDIQRVRQIAGQLSTVAGVVGGDAGRRLGALSDRIAKTIDQSQASARLIIEQMRGDLRSMDQVLKALKDVGRTPNAGDVIEQVVTRFLPGNGDSGNVSVEAVASILSKLQVGDGSLKDEARKALNAGFVARCAELAAAYKAQLEALKNSGKPDAPVTPTEPGCRVVKGADLLKQLEELTTEQPAQVPEAEEPQEPEVLPLVTATGQYSEAVSGAPSPGPPMGSSFQMTANFASGTITFALSGGRTTTGVREPCVEAEDSSIEVEAILVDYTDAYTAQASGALDPETGEFSVAFTPKGGTTDRKATLFTSEGCVHLNSEPAPGTHAWPSGEGTISGYVTKDGAIEFATQWSHCGEVYMQGSWSGYGSVSTP